MDLWNGSYLGLVLTDSTTTTLQRPERQTHRGSKPPAYERALLRTRPVNPSEDRAGLVLAYAELIEGMKDKDGKPRKPQVFVTITPRPLGYDDAPVFAPVLIQGQAELWNPNPNSLHGRPIYVSQKIAQLLKEKVIEEIKRIQGYSPDYICFHERQRNGNHHFHLAMSNVNLSLPAFAPIVERQDKRGKPQLVFRGLERIAWGVMGRGSFELWGGLDGSLSAAYYFTRDMFRGSKGGEVDMEVSELWGKRIRKQPPFIFADNSLWTDQTEAGR